MIVVNYHDDLNEVQGDPALAALLGDAARAPFDRLSWWRNLHDNCGLQPLVAVASDGAERAVLPLMRQGRSLAALANWYSFTVRPLFTAAADRGALLAAIARDLAGHASHLAFAPVPDEGGEASALADAFRRAGWVVRREACDVNHVLDVAGRSHADYLASLPGRLRTTLKRKAGKVAVAIHTAFDAGAWAAYEAIYAESGKPGEGSPAFLRRFAEAEGAAGRLRLGVASAEGVPVAAQLWTVEAGTAFIHKLAHSEAARPLSPGTTLSAALFAHVIDRDRVALVDFGTGDDPYKHDWMDSRRPRYRLDCYRARDPRSWPALARHALRRLARRARAG